MRFNRFAAQHHQRAAQKPPLPRLKVDDASPKKDGASRSGLDEAVLNTLEIATGELEQTMAEAQEQAEQAQEQTSNEKKTEGKKAKVNNTIVSTSYHS